MGMEHDPGGTIPPADFLDKTPDWPELEPWHRLGNMDP
jgi:hypothetical protein